MRNLAIMTPSFISHFETEWSGGSQPRGLGSQPGPWCNIAPDERRLIRKSAKLLRNNCRTYVSHLATAPAFFLLGTPSKFYGAPSKRELPIFGENGLNVRAI